jgi:glycine/D-amino acid oxidase-like deaminating enzyme
VSPSSRIHYNTSLWEASNRSTKRPAHPRLSGSVEADVVVAGGGLTGSLVACQFARAGIDVVLVEAGRAGDSAALDAGWIVETPGVSFRDVQDRYGLKVARRAFETSRRSALDVAAFLRRLGGRVELDPRDALQIAVAGESVKYLEREHQARVEAGLDSAWLPGRRAAADSKAEGIAGSLKTRSEGLVDPFRVGQRLLRAAADAGARIFERSPVTRVRPRRRDVEVTTASGVVSAQAIVIATGMAKPLAPALQRHVRLDETYLVATPELPAAVAGRFPSGVIVRDTVLPGRPVGSPPLASDRSVALTPKRRVVVQGATQAAVAPRLREQTLVQRTGQLMYELSLLYPSISGVMPEYAWTAPRVTGRDGLPIIGVHRAFPRHLFAIGLGSLGLSGAWMAARILLRHYTDQVEAGDDVFGFARLL